MNSVCIGQFKTQTDKLLFLPFFVLLLRMSFAHSFNE